MIQKNKHFLILIFLLACGLSACTGAGPAATPLSTGPENSATGADNKPGSAHTPGDSTANTDNSVAPSSNTDSGAVAMITPPAQPTQPLTPQLGLFVDGIVLLPDTDPNTKCEKGFETIPIVKVLVRNPNENWKLHHIVDKSQENSESTPEALQQKYLCGKFTTHFPLSEGTIPEPCLPPTNEVKITASYRSSSGSTYYGESKVYTCHDSFHLPNAMIVLENKMTHQVMIPK